MKTGKVVKDKSTGTTMGLIVLVVGIIFLASNLRAPITSIGPVVNLIIENLGISNTAAGIITTVPLLAFAVISPFAPRLARKFGMETVLFGALILLLIGLILRPLGGVTLLFGGTIFIGIAIAMGNVLMPALIKMNFANNIGLMTGIYAVSMNLTGALASGFSIPLAGSTGFGWKLSLGFWTIPAVFAIIIWLPQIRKPKKVVQPGKSEASGQSLRRSKLAWQVTIFMGLQSLLFYAIVAWLPVILQGQGMSPGKSGWMLSAIQFSQLPFTFIVPVIAGKMKNQKPLVWITFLLMTAGISGIMFGGTTFVLPSVIVIGIAGAFAFTLAMMFFTLRTRDSFQAADLSGMAQSFGYLLAASGPPLFGLLYDVTNGWMIPLGLLLVATFGILIFGLGAAKDEYIEAL